MKQHFIILISSLSSGLQAQVQYRRLHQDIMADLHDGKNKD